MFVIKTLLDAGDQFADHDGFAFLHGGEVKGDVLCCHTVFLRVRRVIVLFGALQERLGRDTTYIEARTAYGILLKEDDVFTGFTCFLGCRVSGRTAAYDGKKISFHVRFTIYDVRFIYN